MGSNYETVGPVPAEENCQQVGTKEYDHDKAQAETRAYKHQLQRMFPKAKFGIKSFPHDFGNYMEVVVEWDEHGAEAEANLPANWDEEALVEMFNSPAFNPNGYFKSMLTFGAVLRDKNRR